MSEYYDESEFIEDDSFEDEDDDFDLDVLLAANLDGDDRDQEIQYRGSSNDYAFGFILAVALSIGLTPLLPDSADLRYTIVWLSLATVGVLAWLLGNSERVVQETPDVILWGVGFGVLLSAPFLLFFASALRIASGFLFPQMSMGTLLAYLIFVMPLAETLFFRGVLQHRLNFGLVGLLSWLWSLVLFLPVMWADILNNPAVGVSIAIGLLLMNVLYSYVRDRNGLAATWITQITVNLLMVFIPSL